jgi:hypothetical protein
MKNLAILIGLVCSSLFIVGPVGIILTNSFIWLITGSWLLRVEPIQFWLSVAWTLIWLAVLSMKVECNDKKMGV